MVDKSKILYHKRCCLARKRPVSAQVLIHSSTDANRGMVTMEHRVVTKVP